MNLYPMKFKPILKTKIWGGEKIRNIYRHGSSMAAIGESWDVSGIEGNESEVENGYLSENTLPELVEVYMGDLVGDHVYERYGAEFPVLLKIIDAAADLSVQVHPDDSMAQRLLGCSGKSEMWYVISAEPDAMLAAGFTRETSREELENLIGTSAFGSLLRWHPVRQGDVFMIPAGTVHAIGRGSTVIEIQQPVDITYRLYDYGRLDSDGRPRPLHVDEALQATHYDSWQIEPLRVSPRCGEVIRIADIGDIAVNLMALDHPKEYIVAQIDSFIILTCAEGHVNCVYGDDHLTLVPGESLLIPAEMTDMTLVPTGHVRLLETYIR